MIEENERLALEVITIHADKQRTRRIIDHNNREDRVWLGKHCFWAFRNGAEVRTRAV